MRWHKAGFSTGRPTAPGGRFREFLFPGSGFGAAWRGDDQLRGAAGLDQLLGDAGVDTLFFTLDDLLVDLGADGGSAVEEPMRLAACGGRPGRV